MLLNHKAPHVLSVPVSFDKSTVQEKNLLPGVNEVSAELVEALKKHPILKERFDSGSLEVVEEGGKPVEGLDKVKEGKAVSLVKATVDLGLLNKWLEEAKNGVVLRTIRDQIEKIENPDKEQK